MRFCPLLSSFLLFFQFVVIEILSIPCIPKKRHLGILIGQDYASILNYTYAFQKEHGKPFGFMSYTTLVGTDGNLTGLIDPINYGSGIEWSDGIIRSFPKSSMNLGLYLVDQLDSINSGEYDSIFLQLVDYINQRKGICDFYLRIGYEFDNPENHYDGQKYQLAYRRIVSFFRKKNALNVLFVWHSMSEYALFEKEFDYSAWFPGESYVDLCGVSIFQQPYRCSSQSVLECKMSGIENFSQFCQRKSIPLMIAESTPFGGLISREEEKANVSIVNRAGFRGNTWDHWFRHVLQYIDQYDVRLWSYINCDWDSFPMWQKSHAPGVYWGDSRLQGKFVYVSFDSNLIFVNIEHENIANLWENEVLQSSRTLLTYSDCTRANSSLLAKSISIELMVLASIIFIGILMYYLSDSIKAMLDGMTRVPSRYSYERL